MITVLATVLSLAFTPVTIMSWFRRFQPVCERASIVLGAASVLCFVASGQWGVAGVWTLITAAVVFTAFFNATRRRRSAPKVRPSVWTEDRL